VRRGYLGAGLRTATFEMENRPGIYKSGATINNVVAGSPAEAYGLQVDDIILNINGEAVRTEQGGFSTGMVILDADGTPMAEVGSLKSVVLNARLAQQDGLIMNVRLKDELMKWDGDL